MEVGSINFEKIILPHIDKNGISSGSIHGNRLAVGPDLEKDIFWASSNHLFRLEIENRDFELNLNDLQNGFFPLPKNIKGKVSSVESAKHLSEIQSLHHLNSKNGDSVIYSVDSSGFASVNLIKNEKVSSFMIKPPVECANIYHGWVGISGDPLLTSRTITARYSDKLVCVYDEDKLIRQMRSIQNPTQILALENGLLAMTERNHYSLWDLRVASSGYNGVITSRVQVSPEILYTLDSAGYYLAVAGVDRSISIFDLRRDGIISKWIHCLKYEITKVLFSKQDPSVCIVSGLDNEIIIGKSDGSKSLSHFEGLRIESRWAGITNHQNNDTVLGISQQGEVYIITNFNSLLNRKEEKQKFDSCNKKIKK